MKAMPQQPARSSVKLVDVARLAGCSPATVSRVLNDHPKVGQVERERVLKAAAELGYVPNGSARALRSSRSRLAGAIIPTLDHAIYATMVDGLQARLAEGGVSLIINTSAYDLDLEYAQARLLIEHGAESIVLVGAEHKQETLDLLAQNRVAHVFTYTVDADEEGAAVGFDNAKAGATAAKFLHDLGHRRFAMIAGITQDNDRARQRLEGFLAALGTLGHDPAAVTVVEARYRVDGGRNAMRSILQQGEMPTAVFCGSDILAAGVVKYCQEHGISVPGDLSLVGFDNLEIAALISPELTTLEVPARDMGVEAADYILSDAAKRRHLRRQELPVRLIVRQSTGPAMA